MPTNSHPILAVVVKDCAAKLVIRYHFSQPMTRRTLALLEDSWPCTAEVHEFSRFVSGAKDAFKVVGTEVAFLAQGILGEKVLRVTFGWLSTPKEQDRALATQFDQFLVDAGLGDHLVRDDQRR